MQHKDSALALAAIKRHYLFSALQEAELERLVASVKCHQLKIDEFLFRQEQDADWFFLVADGQIKLFRSAPDGNEKVVEIITAGQTIAEALMFMRRPCFPVHAQAVQPSRVYAIPTGVYRDLLKDNHETCMHILGDLSMRLHARLSDVLNLTQQNATYRVVRFLLSQLPSQAKESGVIYLTTPKQVIASRLSVKPETLSRIMSTLAREGIIEVKGREILVQDIERLRHFE